MIWGSNYILASVTAPPLTIFKPLGPSGSIAWIGEASKINKENKSYFYGLFSLKTKKIQEHLWSHSLPARAATETISTDAINIIWPIFSNSVHCDSTKTLKCFQYWLIDGIYFEELIKSNAKIKKHNASVGFLWELRQRMIMITTNHI